MGKRAHRPVRAAVARPFRDGPALRTGDLRGDESILRTGRRRLPLPSRPERGPPEPLGGAHVPAGDPGRGPARRPPCPGASRPGVDPEGRGGFPVHPPHDDRNRSRAGRSPVGGGPVFHHHRPGGGVLRAGVRPRPYPRRGDVRAGGPRGDGGSENGGQLRGEPPRGEERQGHRVRPGPLAGRRAPPLRGRGRDDEHLLRAPRRTGHPPALRVDSSRGDAGHRPHACAGMEDPGGGASRGDRRGSKGGRGRNALGGVRFRDGGGHLPGGFLLLPREGCPGQPGRDGGTFPAVLPGDHGDPVRGDRGPPPVDPPGGVRGTYKPRAAIRASRVTPATRTILLRPLSPVTSVMRLLGTPTAFARKRTRASLAFPSTGGAFRRIFTTPPSNPATPSFEERGTTRTDTVAEGPSVMLTASGGRGRTASARRSAAGRR